MSHLDWSIEIAAENALIVYSTSDSLVHNNQRIMQLNDHLTLQQFPWLISVIPAYQSLLVTYDISQVDHYFVKDKINKVIPLLENKPEDLIDDNSRSKIIELPVCYDYPKDNDLSRVAQYCGMTEAQVIDIHCNPVYQVFCLGFAPGFAYMGQVDERIKVPRLSSVRKSVPKGAVAIAERQTAIYPNTSPGGWNILGLCPLTLFSPNAQSPCKVQTGDRVKFVPIEKAEYLQLEKQQSKEPL
ncbi:5-oxoprolinase subunit PxpB [Aliiglaciecola sp.]|nr:5-oxoprolinase subunit PxpB [Aliiglaciecola sp.]